MNVALKLKLISRWTWSSIFTLFTGVDFTWFYSQYCLGTAWPRAAVRLHLMTVITPAAFPSFSTPDHLEPHRIFGQSLRFAHLCDEPPELWSPGLSLQVRLRVEVRKRHTEAVWKSESEENQGICNGTSPILAREVWRHTFDTKISRIYQNMLNCSWILLTCLSLFC